MINSIKQMHKVILNKLFLMFVVVQNLIKNLNVKKLAIVLTVDQNLNKLSFKFLKHGCVKRIYFLEHYILYICVGIFF